VVVFAVIGFAIVYFTGGMQELTAVASGNNTNTGSFKVLLVAQQIGLFLTPAILLSIIEGKKLAKFYGLAIPKVNLLLLVAVLSICWMPLMGLSNELNQKLALPDFLKGVERWMKQTEADLAKTTAAILKMQSVGDLLINLFVIAIVPAICEELVFRGALQRTIFRLKSNPHVAIWLSAIIFSTIHFQFYGFLPRMLLGAAFGYIYFWTGSIWYAVFAHFLNNAYAVCLAFYLQSKNQSYTNVDDVNMQWYGYLISGILTIALFFQISQKFKIINRNDGDGPEAGF
jgi:membrane protease YdiL (CAAX protease family)